MQIITNNLQAKIAVDTIVSAFSQYCNTKYTAEIVEVVYPDKQTFYYPELRYRTEEINYNKAIKYIGIKYVIKSFPSCVQLRLHMTR